MGEAAFLRKLRRAFAAEAEERLSAMESALMALEAIGPGPLDAENAAWLETFYRDVHSLKGASRTVDAPALETVCQPLESALGELKAGRISPSPAFFDLLHKALKVLRSLLSRFDPESDDTTLPPPGD
ncbi:Hpt domain-containing protein, partial [Desulfocurvibacter africanus]